MEGNEQTRRQKLETRIGKSLGCGLSVLLEDGGEVAGGEGDVLGPDAEAAVLVYGTGPFVQEFALGLAFVGVLAFHFDGEHLAVL